MPEPLSPVFLYGTAWKEERTAALTELAIRTGFRAIDTANQRRHYFEEGVGLGLAASYRSGVVQRTELFLQTKFTYQRGQDHRLPYDPNASLVEQVAQSLISSLQNLDTDHVDSFVLHGPSSSYEWTASDVDVWGAMLRERDAGRTRLVGVSNVGLRHLQQMAKSGCELPGFVQNRCFASTGWDREVREFCRQHEIVYQGFSLLTANRELWQHPPFVELAQKLEATPAQVIFSFARAVGMLPLTGTSDQEHMKQDLATVDLKLPDQIVRALEAIGS